ncbi:MAG: hypothetical protein ACFFDH_26035 [Promethearchaeota archaeon]
MNNKIKKKLIFVYNADSGVFNVVKDFWKKILRPSSYPCNLCSVTFGTFGIKKEWKNFVNTPKEFSKNENIEFEFLHKDEFNDKYDVSDAKFPSAYILDNTGIKLFIKKDEMNRVQSIDELKKLVNTKIVEFRL